MRRSLLLCLFALAFAFTGFAQTTPGKPDLTKQPTLYVVPYAHLDTEWRWDYARTIGEFLPKTLRDNFDLFERYPHYVFNFSGANRYRMMKEYYPADYERMKRYIAAGRWFPAGSSMEENDVNSPSAESIIRQILYGKQFFRREFGKTSAEFMLPDCFGFPASLPSILAHAGIKGFSTQKLSWKGAAPVGGPDSPEKTPFGIPFNVGFWQGLDGHGVIAALNAMDYDGDITYDVTKPPVISDPNARNKPVDWVKRVQMDGEVSGLFADFEYYGTGDTGGAPRELSIRAMEAIVTRGKAVFPVPRLWGEEQREQSGPAVQVGDGPLHVVQATAEQMFLDIKPEQTARLPRYQGDLELIEHSAGSLTSQAYLKRWNRQNEVLADAAERASVAAAWLGGRPYPQKRLTDAWTLVMGGQFHDIIPGTSIPKAYEYAWNDQLLALNQFAGVLTSATEAVASGLNTEAKGVPVVVFNPLSIPREDVAEAGVSFPDGTAKAVRVIGPDGKEVPAQMSGAKVLFVAKLPPVGYAVYDVQAAESTGASPLKVSESMLENARYAVKLDQNGDVAGIYDNGLKRELLSAPIRLAIKTDKPVDWPAWNMDWADQQKPPRAYVGGQAKIRVVENGPVRVAVEVTRETESSKFVQTIRLATGNAGNRLEFANAIDWRMPEANLKATFPLSAANPLATYNWDIGKIQRGNNEPKKFEVASHQWVDLTDTSGAFGVTVLTDAKNGSDKPDDNTLRLTLLRTPGLGTGNGRDYADQTSQDWGHHEFVYGLAAHAGDWRKEQTDWQALRLNQPLLAFETAKHAGALGKSFSLLNVSNPRVRVMALKKAEQSDEFVIRLVELDGKPQPKVRIAFAAPITVAREINGAEEPVGDATVSGGELIADFTAYQPRTFAVKLAPPKVRLSAPKSEAVALAYDRSIATPDGHPGAGAFDRAGRAFPAEMLPREVNYDGIRFALAPAGEYKPNAVAARGQTIALPEGQYNRVYVLAASDRDQRAEFRVGDKPFTATVQNWSGYIGQWDNRIWKQQSAPLTPEEQARTPRPQPRMIDVFDGLTPGYVKPAPVAWFASHRHNSDGANEPYQYSYLFAYTFEVPPGARTLTLPNHERIRILAITVAETNGEVRSVSPLYDNLERAGSK